MARKRIQTLRTTLPSPIPHTRSNRKYMGIPALWEKLVQCMRKIQKPQNQESGEETFSSSQWQVVIFHDLKCSESIYHAGGVEYVSVDMAQIPSFLQQQRESPVAFRKELDRSQGDNYQCGILNQPTSTLDCRYYYDKVEYIVDAANMERNGGLQRTHGYQKTDWPKDEDNQLPSEVLLKGRDERKREESFLGWVESDGDV